MTIAHGLFQKFRAQRNESSRPYRTQYSEFLKELATGGEVDLESLEICCSALNVTEPQLQKDIETTSRRLASQATIQQAEQAAIELREVEGELQRLRLQQASYNEKMNAAIYEKRQVELNLQSRLSEGHAARAWLRQNVQDAELLERIQDHANRRQMLLDQQKRCEENLNSRYDTRLNSVRSARTQLPILKSFKKLDSKQADQLRIHEENLRLHEPYVLQMEAELQAVRREFAMLDSESEELEREKLLA